MTFSARSRSPSASDTRVVYSVFDLVDQRVRSHPAKDAPIFADVPGGPDDFSELGTEDRHDAVLERRSSVDVWMSAES